MTTYLKIYHVTTSSPRADGKDGFAIIPFQGNYASEEELEQALDSGGAPGFQIIYERIDPRTRRVRDKFERTLRKKDCQLIRMSTVEYVF